MKSCVKSCSSNPSGLSLLWPAGWSLVRSSVGGWWCVSQFPSEEKGGKEALNICISDAYSSPPPCVCGYSPQMGKERGEALTKWRKEKEKRVLLGRVCCRLCENKKEVTRNLKLFFSHKKYCNLQFHYHLNLSFGYFGNVWKLYFYL